MIFIINILINTDNEKKIQKNIFTNLWIKLLIITTALIPNLRYNAPPIGMANASIPKATDVNHMMELS